MQFLSDEFVTDYFVIVSFSELLIFIRAKIPEKFILKKPAQFVLYLCIGMTVMAKVVTTLEICENAKLARDLALTGNYIDSHFFLLVSMTHCFVEFKLFV